MVIGNKWVYQVKLLLPNRSLDKYKARVVAKGYDQVEGIDYSETFNHVFKPTTFWIVFTITIFNDLVVRQLDVNNDIFNDNLEKKCISQLLGFVNS